ncbi:glutathione S-transferase N-terminal domain-containing protein, partial [Halorhodospira sp. 9622]|uniref:glutathione S-transferase N-terminal domain-containing protein n=1 Tax=Halorhodospira sp. 9622 TaxID=2899136 RepID=UPI00210853EE
RGVAGGPVIRLYTGASCIHSHRARLALALKGVEAERVPVDPERPPASLLEQNPYGDVPTLVDRDIALYHPEIIIDYLDERYPHPPLLPVDPVSRAKARLVVHRMQRDWYALCEQIENGTAAQAQQARRALRESLVAAAELFEGQPYFLSDELTIMDLTILPLLWRLSAAGVELPEHAAAITQYAEQQFATDAFRTSLTREELGLRA